MPGVRRTGLVATIRTNERISRFRETIDAPIIAARGTPSLRPPLVQLSVRIPDRPKDHRLMNSCRPPLQRHPPEDVERPVHSG